MMKPEDFGETLSQIYNRYENEINKGYLIKNDSDSPIDAIMNNLAEREDYYTKLTENFVSINYKRYKYKEFHKWVFFWVMTVIMVFVTVIFGIIAVKTVRTSAEEFVKHLPVLLGSYASFISTIIAVPLLIGKYLFNKTEEADLSKIVENMQEYDRKGQELFQNALNHKNEKQEQNNDNCQ